MELITKFLFKVFSFRIELSDISLFFIELLYLNRGLL